MKCENCGANLVDNKCAYCGYEVKEEEKEVNIYIENTNTTNKYVQKHYNHEENVNKKNIWVQIILWLLFWYVMIFVVIIKSDKISKKTKIIICAVIGVIFILIGTTGNSNKHDVESDQIYNVGTEALSGDYEILVTDYNVEDDEDNKVLVIDYELKYIGSYPSKISTVLYLDYKLNDTDGLVFQKDLTYKVERLPSYLETGDKGKGQVAYELDNTIDNDLIFNVFSDNYSTDCDVKYVLPKEELQKKMP